jgi:hypothetical protein
MSFPDTLIMLSRATTTCQICNKIADFTQDQMNLHFPHLSCHSAKETTVSGPYLFDFHGYLAHTLQDTATKFGEAGLFLFYLNFHLFVEESHSRMRVEVLNYRKEKYFEELKIQDLKILSVFIAWGGLMLVWVHVFLIETFLLRLAVLLTVRVHFQN